MAGEAEALRIVETALAVEDPSSRAAFVVAQCAGDAELLARVRALLRRSQQGQGQEEELEERQKMRTLTHSSADCE